MDQKNKQQNKDIKILVIDDDDGIIQAFRVILEMAGYQFETSMNADVIKTFTKKNIPHLILLDVLLSGADGRDICFKLKKQALTKDIPIIMISAHPSAKKSIKEMGADDFLAKPFEMKALLSKIKKYTG